MPEALKNPGAKLTFLPFASAATARLAYDSQARNR
jgi:hypothetical protein